MLAYNNDEQCCLVLPTIHQLPSSRVVFTILPVLSSEPIQPHSLASVFVHHQNRLSFQFIVSTTQALLGNNTCITICSCVT